MRGNQRFLQPSVYNGTCIVVPTGQAIRIMHIYNMHYAYFALSICILHIAYENMHNYIFRIFAYENIHILHL